MFNSNVLEALVFIFARLGYDFFRLKHRLPRTLRDNIREVSINQSAINLYKTKRSSK